MCRGQFTPTKSITVIHCWSAPRSRSTALCYSFESRSDCIVIDEPLYRPWLIKQGSSVTRPYLKGIVEGVPPDPSTGYDPATNEKICKWKRELLSKNERIVHAAAQVSDGGVIFCKEMARFHTIYDFANEMQSTVADGIICHFVHKHVLLIRDPVSVISSWGVASTIHGDFQDVGIVPMLSIYSTLQSRTNNIATEPVVILDSDDLVADPKHVLKEFCKELGIEFMESMMKWKKGPHDCDGPWASWWYRDAHKTDGWDVDVDVTKKQHRRYRTLKPEYMLPLKASYPAYEYLKRQSASYAKDRPLPSEIYEDPRNEHLLVFIGKPNGGGRIVPREIASISPWDSSVQGGDACWEGIRVYRGKVLHLEKHLKRLMKSAKALGFVNVHTKEEIIEAIFSVLAANGMRDGAHIRLTLTRGEKCTSSMNPKFNIYGTTLIILPEWKKAEGETTHNNTVGISLISASQRRSSPQTVDSKIHHNNLINNILPKIQANHAGAGDAIMLDVDGFVAETNVTNMFMVDDGVLLTPQADHCLPGIPRDSVLELAKELNIPTVERRITLAEFQAADEVFTASTMGELTPVVVIDGRVIGTGTRGEITFKLQELYKTLPDRGDSYATPLPDFES